MADNDFRAVSADIDGTLITQGDVENLNPSLKKTIKDIRDKGILFSLNSGRDLIFQKSLFNTLTGNGNPGKGEAILYEDLGLYLFNGEKYIFGGLDKETLQEINALERKNPELFKGLTNLPNNNFEYRTSWVTEEFANNHPTNVEVLQSRYPGIKEFIEQRYSGLQVAKSADAIDVVAKDMNKRVPFRKYLEILSQKYSILPNQVFVIGDAENDFGVMESVLEKGGHVGFVGDENKLEKRLAEDPNFHISNEKGPDGTIELIKKYIL